MPQIYSVDGNIGAGKSTILSELKKRGYFVFEEDLICWGNLLDAFYENPSRWMFTFQVKILYSMVKQFEKVKNSKHDIVFIERSPKASCVFINVGKLNGFLNEDEMSTLKEIFSCLEWNQDFTYFVDTDTNLCVERIAKRKRECEKDISIEYLNQLDSEYKNIYNSENSLNIDGKLTPSEIVDEIVKDISNKKMIEKNLSI
ncbi:118R [Cherax quadricarinatus iridovirus]|uniref:Deoxynucleoside kinase n=1 Tax=Shrimp hemocyte iridescent virus TaxID=2039780 RepID=A0A291B0M3_9VIRU|nr:118R [Cherax quadricarinatus iridovirus]YP_010084788.1 deoxynucleoside kinase [Shrimp hemocyte iridescent virus]UPA43428.1 deoxynucleoside kinase [Iridovirus CN01]ASZ85098.1 118R [Cherax quadricarinatus iridovirus]ATE87045.1 deoxynucleoside kinase [Shrimp hemocyte iridescent virus]UPA43504.1 deoxynucleoside kinase [Iridovirus CN01]UPA43700.1 deoxynucleoside kinase [Iridovirus CN01]